MHFENRHYVIFDLTEVGTIDFSEVMETSADTLRKNLANTQSFVKYEGAMPASVTALTTKSSTLTQRFLRCSLGLTGLTLTQKSKWVGLQIMHLS
jgi:hypothetical protein